MIGVSSTLVSFGCQKFSAVGYGLPLLVVPASLATATMLGAKSFKLLYFYLFLFWTGFEPAGSTENFRSVNFEIMFGVFKFFPKTNERILLTTMTICFHLFFGRN